MSYFAAVIADLPAIYWRLDEAFGSANTVDSSGHGIGGTIFGTPAFGSPGLIHGDPDTAARFVGTAEYAISGTVFGPTAFSTGCTLETLLKVDSGVGFGNPVKMGTPGHDAIVFLLTSSPNVAADASGHGRDGHYGGDPNDVTKFAFSQPGLVGTDTCVFVNGDEIPVPVDSGTFGGDFTLGCWVDNRGTQGPINLGQYFGNTGEMVTFDYQPGGNPSFSYLLRLQRFWSYPNVQTYQALGTLTPGKHFLAVRHVAATGVTTFFVDGASIGAVTITAHAMVGPAVSGQIAGTSLGSGAAVDESFIVSAAVADVDIAGLYTAAGVSSAAWNAAVVALTPANFYHLNEVTPSRRVQFLFNDGAIDWVSGVGFPINDGDIHHFAGKYEDNAVKLYADGILYEHQAVTPGSYPTLPASSYFKINDGPSTFDLTVDEPAFYGYPVPDAHLLQHAQLATTLGVDATLSPTVRLVTSRALVVPHQVQRWTLPIICTNKVATGAGETIEMSQDVGEVRDFFVALRRSGQPVILQMGAEEHRVVVRDVSFPDGQVDRWGIGRNGLQGTLIVNVDSVNF